MAMITPRQLSRDLEGVPTEILLQTFADRIMVLVTQIGKVGNLIQATIPATTPLPPAPAPDPAHPNEQPLPPPPYAIQLTPLLGGAPSDHMQTLHSLYAAQMATIVWTAEAQGPFEVSRRGVIVGLALRKSGVVGDVGLTESEKATFRGTMSMLQELLAK